MSGLAIIIALALCTGASFFFSGVETGIYVLNRVRLRLRSEEGDPAAVRVLGLLATPQALISTILVGNHLANFGASYFCQEYLRSSVKVGEPEIWATLILTPFLFVFGEITPKNVFRLRADPLVYRTSRALRGARIAFWPLAQLLRWLGRVSGAIPRTTTPPDAILSRSRLRALVGEVAEDGVLTDEQQRMVTNVMRISTLPVLDVMVPLSEADTVREGFGRATLVQVSARNGRSRIPVLTGEEGRPEGIVNVLDLVYRPGVPLGELVQQVPLIPGTASVDHGLRALRAARKPMGFVTDPEGRVVGIVTVKDLVEEISGELPAF